MFFVSTSVRLASKHAMKCDHPHTIEVRGFAMMKVIHSFGRHIPWCAARAFIIDFLYARNAKISQPQIAIAVKDEVFWLYISVNNIVIVDVL